ncbi:uncharacterized protein METZ01_LOCUS94437, partial [marine metagenome]
VLVSEQPATAGDQRRSPIEAEPADALV